MKSICDPDVEDCSIHANPIRYPAESASKLYVFAFVSLVNAIAPSIWYAVSYDYSGKNKNNPRRSNNVEIIERSPVIRASPTVLQRNGNRGKGGDRYNKDFDAPRRRGNQDDLAWYSLSRAHLYLWGTSFAFFIFYLIGWLEEWYAWYIAHWISNVGFVVYIYGLVSLGLDASQSEDTQGFLEFVVYGILFASAGWFMEATTGESAIMHLDPDYPYNDGLLMPSLFYIVGILDHTKRLTIKEIEDGSAREPFENDGSIDDDVVIDNFNAVDF